MSVDTGTLEITCSAEGNDVTLIWTERGGPAVEKPDHPGFGTTLINRMANWLGGAFASDWSSGGVIVRLTMEKDRLAR